MCRMCLIEVRPDRERLCTDAGAYVLNLGTCAQCQRRPMLRSVDRRCEETDDPNGDFEEIVTFVHQCATCSHVIAEHYYSFVVTHQGGRTIQDFVMDCVLCGRGADTSVLHHDNDEAGAATTTATTSSSVVRSNHVVHVSTSSRITAPATAAELHAMHHRRFVDSPTPTSSSSSSSSLSMHDAGATTDADANGGNCTAIRSQQQRPQQSNRILQHLIGSVVAQATAVSAERRANDAGANDSDADEWEV